MRRYGVPSVAKAIYWIADDQSAERQQSEVIEYRSERWLVATWLESQATGTRYPGRIVPMAKLPHLVLSEGLIELTLLVPRPLLEPGDLSPQLQLQFSPETHPGLLNVPGPSSIQ